MPRALTRTTAVLAAALLLLTACGREGTEEALQVSRAAQDSPTPEATATPEADVEATEAPDQTAAPDEAPATAQPAAAATPTPVVRAQEGGVNQPKAGEYTWDTKGEQTDPTNPVAPPEKYEGTRNADISNDGDVTTRTDTSSEEVGRTTIRTRYEPTQVLLLSFKAETQVGDFSCEFDPPLVITKVPVKPEKYPTQTMKGRGNACDGKLDIEIVRKESANDATGKAWSTWRVKVRQEFKSGQLTMVTDDTRWVAPDLGVEVRNEFASNGKYGTQEFKANGTSVLRKHP